ncbi:MAG: hypothetical protein Q9219_001600 [cf. Caloplaca sp. 3 TL-2023]
MEKLKCLYNTHLPLRDKEEDSQTDYSTSRWRSPDLDPVPRQDKKWEWYHVGGFWIAEGFSAAQVQTSSAAVAVGLNPGLALAAYTIGNLIIAIPCCASGYMGSRYSVNFPVLARAYGIQSYVGGQAVQAMIESIWPSFINWHKDVFPPSADITAPALLGVAIFWMVSLPFLYISPPKLRWVFMAKIVTMPFLWVALFTWALTAAGGFGPLLRTPSKPPDGMSTGYLFCYAVTAANGGAPSTILELSGKPGNFNNVLD